MTLLPYSSRDKSERPDYSPHIPEISQPSGPGGRSRIIALVSGFVIVLLALAFSYYFLVLKKSAPQVSLDASAPEKVFLGEKFDLTMNYENDSKDSLLGAKLVIALPDGIVLAGTPQDKRFDEEDLGDVTSGNYGKRTISLVALNGLQTVRKIPIKLQYTLEGSGPHEFGEMAEVAVAIGSPAVAVNITAPQSVIGGQKFNVAITYHNDSNDPFSNVHLILQYPQGVSGITATSSPEIQGNNGDFTLGDLAPGAGGGVTISGTISGASSNVTIPMKLNVESGGQTYTLWTAAPAITVAQAPLTLDLSVNGASDFVAHPGNDLRYIVHYKNTSEATFQNVEIQVKLTSTIVDFSRLNTKGTFDSRANAISWNSTSVPELTNVAPGAEGNVDFTIPVIDAIPVRRVADKNFAVHAEGTIQSPTVPVGTDAQKTVSFAALDTKVAGSISVEPDAYYSEPSRLVKNTGPYPLQANKATRFTVHWKLQNTITDMQGVSVSAKLDPRVSFTGFATSSIGAAPSYNAQSGTVTWTIARVSAGAGIITTAPEAIFQIEITPAVNQVGEFIELMGETDLSATDAWTSSGVNASALAITSNSPGGDGRVR